MRSHRTSQKSKQGSEGHRGTRLVPLQDERESMHDSRCRQPLLPRQLMPHSRIRDTESPRRPQRGILPSREGTSRRRPAPGSTFNLLLSLDSTVLKNDELPEFYRKAKRRQANSGFFSRPVAGTTVGQTARGSGQSLAPHFNPPQPVPAIFGPRLLPTVHRGRRRTWSPQGRGAF